ncbi:MAG: bifunctional phosphoribosylaminoimidazolecarboxamide formyltransferase/IMP cyclohydrolase [Phycisphaerales bacterium]|nr:bifunctional phosphoribosylaminoimidazolecarboxamide formyltransferase/IMP cyclohydrolase [Phycisphaerales bacterium]MCB9863676.1 bifunctional phosphoribosylaminoimidazolecarboxamide formyltransferase/IMP cyclohydrolase [Phycisphaerales bacterium]
MADISIKRALIAVFDKRGVAEFARTLVDEFGIEIISTGGTAACLKEAGVPVTMVEDVTGFPELLDGRVKTLHPKIHAGILADRDNPEHMRQLREHGIQPIDMVVVNLYPFEDTIERPDCTFDEAIEMIDIGGPCMLRAAAKNHKHVLVVDQAHLYDVVIDAMRTYRDEDDEEGWQDLYKSNGFGAFWETGHYDSVVASWLSKDSEDDNPLVHTIRLWSWGALRYGENSHQGAEMLSMYGDTNPLDLTSTDGHAVGEDEEGETVPMSYNNYVDADAAIDLCAEIHREIGLAGGKSAGAAAADDAMGIDDILEIQAPRPTIPTCVFIKHTNACGVGIATDPIEAYRRAYVGDPNAAMGGILAVNFKVGAEFADAVMGTLQRFGQAAATNGCEHPPQAFFVEVIVAPGFDQDAVNIIRSAKKWGQRVRLLEVGMMDVAPTDESFDCKRIAGGMLIQSPDLVGLNELDWQVVTDRAPTKSEMDDLRLAWLVCKHTKSNAISICRNGMLIGNGAGQMSRVMSCRIATWLAKENGHTDMLAGAVAASDAFFPFRDGLDILADAGVTAIIQPGGSKRDAEVIAAANERGIAMITTGIRHFRH